MKVSKYTFLSFLMLIVVAAAYRAIPGRPWGFAPQFAMAIFSGSVIKDRKLAFLLPLLSLLISDVFYELLYVNGIFEIKGFYEGMWINYLLFGSLTILGFFIKNDNPLSIAKGALAAPTIFFFASNFMTWFGGGGYIRPKTLSGLTQALIDGIPFYSNSLVATFVFGTVLFGGFYWLKKSVLSNQAA